MTTRALAAVNAGGRLVTWLVSGLRGAGKTTCIAMLSRQAPAGTQMALLTQDGMPADTANGWTGIATAMRAPGCPCCAGHLPFKVALTRFLRQRPAAATTLWIEGGQDGHGAAERALIEREFGAHLSLAGVVAVVDPRPIAHATAAMRERLAQSLAAADRVVANRADLAGPAVRAAFERFMGEHAPRLHWRYATRGELPHSWLGGEDAAE